MGACASVPKDLKAEAGAAPPPEPPKEETTTAAPKVGEVTAEEGEKKVDGTGDDKPKNDEVAKEEKVAEDGGKDQGESKQESTATTGAEAVPSTTVKAEEEKAEPSPVYDSPPKKDESEKPYTNIAEVAKEANKNEEITQKS